jgi:DNA-binding transcriptional regulator YiaG
MTPDAIRLLRATLRENTATFGQRFAVSGRTVECWEQGRRTPRGLTARVLAQLATPPRRHPSTPRAIPGAHATAACAISLLT